MKYLEAYRELHRRGEFPGWAIRPFVGEIAALVQKHGATSLLDYGCGEGKQYSVELVHLAWGGLMPSLYDPGSEGRSWPPIGIYGGVICTDVAEHVPEEEVPAFCAALGRHAGSFLFVSVCCRLAKRKLPDGSNCHVTLKPLAWWEEQLRAHLREGCELVLRETP